MIVKNLFFKQDTGLGKLSRQKRLVFYRRGEEYPEFAPWSNSLGANLVTISDSRFKQQ